MCKLAIYGSAAIVISCAGFCIIVTQTSLLYVTILYILRLIGIGCIMMPIVTWRMNAIETKDTAHGTALLTSLRTISGAIGSTVLVAVMTAS